MTTQPENKEPKISKDELSESELAKVTGGDNNTTKSTTKSASNTQGPTETVTLTYGTVEWKY